MISVVLVDDHPVFREGVVRALTSSTDFQVTGQAGGGREGLALIADTDPDVAVVDYQMPDMNGADVAHTLRQNRSRTRVLILSAATDAAVVFETLHQGASGYLSKLSRRPELLEAVRQVARGDTVVPPQLTDALINQIQQHSRPSGPALTARELQVLKAFAHGQSVPEFAKELSLAPSTIKTHTKNLYVKLGVTDRAAAVAVAMRRGLLS